MKKNIITIGGGTGSFVLLASLKKNYSQISAIVSMSDSGGSTGKLRKDWHVLPPGDIRQCLLALSNSNQTINKLLSYRYAKGELKGHNFGNILLSTLELVTGDFQKAIQEVSKILNINNKVIPIVLSPVNLVAVLKNKKKITSEHLICEANLGNLKSMKLEPETKANPEAILAIKKASKIIINPGGFFTSIIPIFLAKGLAEEIRKSKSKIIYICNIANNSLHIKNFTVVDYIEELEKYLGKDVINHVIYNKINQKNKTLEKYLHKGEDFVTPGDVKKYPKIKFIAQDLINYKLYKQLNGDAIKRTLVRHDGDKLAKIIKKI